MVREETTDDLIDDLRVQLESAATLIGGKPWGAEHGKPRIYLNAPRRDAKVYAEFPDCPTGDRQELLGGANIVVQIADCGQAASWYSSERKKLARRYWRESLALSAIQCQDLALARDIMDIDRSEMTAELVDEVAAHLVNARLAEARAALQPLLGDEEVAQ